MEEDDDFVVRASPKVSSDCPSPLLKAGCRAGRESAAEYNTVRRVVRTPTAYGAIVLSWIGQQGNSPNGSEAEKRGLDSTAGIPRMDIQVNRPDGL